jgi:hypothetical protein
MRFINYNSIGRIEIEFAFVDIERFKFIFKLLGVMLMISNSRSVLMNLFIVCILYH